MSSLTAIRTFLEGRWRIAAVAVLALIIAVAGGTAVASWSHGEELPKNAAFSYRGSIVTIAALQERMHTLGALYGVEEPKGAAAQAKYWRAAAQADAMTLVLDHAAAAEGVVVSTRQADAVLQQMISSQVSGNQSASFDALLKRFGVSRADVLLEVKRQQEIGLLFQKITRAASTNPTDADVTAYFRAHSSDFEVAPKRHLLNIVVATRSQATALATLAKTMDFATLAKRYSLDGSTRSKGGDLGTVAASALDNAYAKAAFGAPQGGIYGPVQTVYGWNVGKVVAVIAGRTVALAQIRASVVAELKSSRALALWRAWLTTQMQSAGIRYASAYRPADPNRLPVISTPSIPPS